MPPTAEAGKPSPTAAEAQPAGGMALWQVCLAIVVVTFGIDHAAKYWAETRLQGSPPIPIIPGLLRFDYAENTGAAFSLLAGKTGLLGFISFVASVALFFFWRSLPAGERWGRVAVALIFSGAIGNLIDRVFRGFVVDFIDAYWGQHHWPTFNIADSCICVGAAILAWRIITGKV